MTGHTSPLAAGSDQAYGWQRVADRDRAVSRRRLPLITLPALLSAGCWMWTTATPAIDPQTWTSAPTAPVPALADAGRAACSVSPDAPLLLQDQRGPDGALLVWGGVSEVGCLVTRSGEGPFSVRQRFGIPDGIESVLDPVGGEGPSGHGSAIVGGVPPAATTVTVRTASGIEVLTTIDNGRYAAWWPEVDPLVLVVSLDSAGNEVARFAQPLITPPPEFAGIRG